MENANSRISTLAQALSECALHAVASSPKALAAVSSFSSISPSFEAKRHAASGGLERSTSEVARRHSESELSETEDMEEEEEEEEEERAAIPIASSRFSGYGSSSIEGRGGISASLEGTVAKKPGATSSTVEEVNVASSALDAFYSAATEDDERDKEGEEEGKECTTGDNEGNDDGDEIAGLPASTDISHLALERMPQFAGALR